MPEESSSLAPLTSPGPSIFQKQESFDVDFLSLIIRILAKDFTTISQKPISKQKQVFAGIRILFINQYIILSV
jgi:hypothetical protein